MYIHSKHICLTNFKLVLKNFSLNFIDLLFKDVTLHAGCEPTIHRLE